MRLLGHLVAADVRRFRLLLAAWVLLVVALTLVDGLQPLGAGEVRRENTVQIVRGLLAFAQFLFTLVLVPLVVQAHPVVGSQAFWMTRPVPPLTLLSAKGAVLGTAVVAVPVAAQAALMLAYRVPAPQLAGIAAGTALSQAFWVVLLMVAAALTANLARYAAVVGGGAVALGVGMAITAAVLMASEEDRPPMSGGVGSDDLTAVVLLPMLLVVAGIVWLAVQYVTRLRRWSIAAGAAGVVLAFVLTSAWAWPVLRVRYQTPPWAERPGTLQLSLDPDTIEASEESSVFGRPSAWRTLRGRVKLTGIEGGWSASVRLAEAALRLDDGTRLTAPGTGVRAAVPVGDGEEHPAREVLRGLLQVERIDDVSPPRGESPILFFLSERDAMRHAGAAGAYTGRFDVTLAEYAIEAVLPLTVGTSHRTGPHAFRIAGLERRPRALGLLARVSGASSVFDRRPQPAFSYYLRNRRAREAMAGGVHERGVAVSGFLPFMLGRSGDGGFSARGMLVTFPAPYDMGDDRLTTDGRWFDEAELVIVRVTEEATVQRTLTITSLTIDD